MVHFIECSVQTDFCEFETRMTDQVEFRYVTLPWEVHNTVAGVRAQNSFSHMYL